MPRRFFLTIVMCISILTVLLLSGCDRDTPVATGGAAAPALAPAGSADPPAGLVEVTWAGQTLRFWPYVSPDGSRLEDPVNLAFVGRAGAMEIRAALLALDGDRTAYGMPPVYPFNATWSDAMGGVQAAYAEGAGWLGSVIQLQLGSYGPVRFHLRLFETGLPFGDGGVWTLGGAHTEILIAGTPEHQVISWELAEQMVIVDLVRSGLLQAAPGPTAIINAEPGFRTIAPPIYNGIPDALKVACGLPPGPTATPVPIPTNGRATVLAIGGTTPTTDPGRSETLVIQFNQVIPKPFCASGPADYYLVQGPVDLRKDVLVDATGRYSYRYELSGMLTATPVGGGEPFEVRIHDFQNGFRHGDQSFVSAHAQRIAPEDGGAELLMEWLKVGTSGASQFRHEEHCLAP